MKNKKNGVVYLYESTSYWDKEKRQARNTRICIGKIDPDGNEIIYNKRYLERKQQAKEKQRGIIFSFEYKREFCGAIHLFDLISDKLGVCDREILSEPMRLRKTESQR